MAPSAPRPLRDEHERLLAGLSQPPERAARFLLGQFLVRRAGRLETTARIVETEAYLGRNDPAAHAYRGRTPRTEPLFGPPGTLYVYFVYGMHHCLNVSVDRDGEPGCVLIRAAELFEGEALDVRSARGPGRLCRALAIDTALSGRHLFDPRAGLTLREGRAPRRVAVTPRVGIRLAAERLLRFHDAESAAVSPAPRAARGSE